MSRRLDDPDTLREFVRNVREGIYITNTQGEIIDCNQAFLEMLGVASLDELRHFGGADSLVVDPERRREELELLDRDGAIREFELEIRRPDGAVRTVLDTTYVSRGETPEESYYHGILIDITARKELEEKLREQSVRDPLTGCYNRRFLLELEKHFAKDNIEQWGVLYLDIDHFKQYNDRYGHAAGDLVLVKMSRFLMRQLRAEESVIRVGGDEFLVVLVDADEARTAAVADRLGMSALRTAPASFSLGSAVRRPGESFEKTLNRADENLLAVRVIERAPDAKRGEWHEEE
ncbi:MAG: sensor domain-containing diguanylate cyclase [Gemmatimonadota bacterium]|nr:sensor domain-containing diguanylate cyclase [Gemmatimonadota bacterium]